MVNSFRGVKEEYPLNFMVETGWLCSNDNSLGLTVSFSQFPKLFILTCSNLENPLSEMFLERPVYFFNQPALLDGSLEAMWLWKSKHFIILGTWEAEIGRIAVQG
jgi:hypothetical protein